MSTVKAPLDLEIIKERIGLGADKIYAVMGEFDNPEDLVTAGRKIREMGYTKLDAMTPFPVHGIDEALGIPYSKIGWIVVLHRPDGHDGGDSADVVVRRHQLSAGDRRQAAVRFLFLDSDRV